MTSAMLPPRHDGAKLVAVTPTHTVWRMPEATGTCARCSRWARPRSVFCDACTRADSEAVSAGWRADVRATLVTLPSWTPDTQVLATVADKYAVSLPTKHPDGRVVAAAELVAWARGGGRPTWVSWYRPRTMSKRRTIGPNARVVAVQARPGWRARLQADYEPPVTAQTYRRRRRDLLRWAAMTGTIVRCHRMNGAHARAAEVQAGRKHEQREMAELRRDFAAARQVPSLTVSVRVVDLVAEPPRFAPAVVTVEPGDDQAANFAKAWRALPAAVREAFIGEGVTAEAFGHHAAQELEMARRDNPRVSLLGYAFLPGHPVLPPFEGRLSLRDLLGGAQ